ncbi:hypothetical protein OsI_14851 [Oryza sativa Indica Group]|uniref:Uncharacterized protein n=1 Tax=Oryza sativa subsp. indica TaxID=39946 RepID=B8AVD6_ORYSI|nr:hypothetical protein OsI_14851 [Oryza sativa Indica Group]
MVAGLDFGLLNSSRAGLLYRSAAVKTGTHRPCVGPSVGHASTADLFRADGPTAPGRSPASGPGTAGRHLPVCPSIASRPTRTTGLGGPSVSSRRRASTFSWAGPFTWVGLPDERHHKSGRPFTWVGRPAL